MNYIMVRWLISIVDHERKLSCTGTWADFLPAIASEGLRSDASQPGRASLWFRVRRGQLGAVPSKEGHSFLLGCASRQPG